MDWCKLFSRYGDDPAVVKAGEFAEVLFVRGIAWTTYAETGGFIPDYQPSRFGLREVPEVPASSLQARIDALVAVHMVNGEQVGPLWEVVEGGWRVRSYERLQEELTKQIERRKGNAERQRRHRARNGDDSPSDGAPTSQGKSQTKDANESQGLSRRDVTRDSDSDASRDPLSLSLSVLSSTSSLASKEKNSPNPTPDGAGDSCPKHRNKPHPNCRGCKTNARAVRDAANRRGPWCGECDEATRLRGDEDRPERCPCAQPRRLRAVGGDA